MGLTMEINIPLQQIFANSKGGLIFKGGVISSKYEWVIPCQINTKKFLPPPI